MDFCPISTEVRLIPWARDLVDQNSARPRQLATRTLNLLEHAVIRHGYYTWLFPALVLCLYRSFLFSSYLHTKPSLRSFVTMQWSTLLAAAALTQNAAAQNMLRFACSQLVVERTDPLVNPGMKYTPHLHQIVGGDAFNISMDPSTDLAKSSTCTSCSFTQDKSNYWTAVMFFKAKNGTYM
jgi:hypothetical protein